MMLHQPQFQLAAFTSAALDWIGDRPILFLLLVMVACLTAARLFCLAIERSYERAQDANDLAANRLAAFEVAQDEARAQRIHNAVRGPHDGRAA